jgi:predicted nucleotidyltransferase
MFHVEQNVTNEIIAILLQADLHPRGIAEKLSTNHMTVSRKLRELLKDNVVDYRTEGKNKVYFLKKSLEGRNAVLIAELYKQSQVISRYPVLRGIFKSVQELPAIHLAVLFGSYAKGLAVKGSDIDIYLDTDNIAIKQQLVQTHSLLSVKIGTFDTDSILIREIIKNHVIIKGVEVFVDKTWLS